MKFLLIGIFLIGCSNKPGALDIKLDQLQKRWLQDADTTITITNGKADTVITIKK